MIDGREGEELPVNGELLPCPFCAGKTQFVRIVGDDETKFCYQVVCYCSARGAAVGWYRSDVIGVDQAVQEWNKRA